MASEISLPSKTIAESLGKAGQSSVTYDTSDPSIVVIDQPGLPKEVHLFFWRFFRPQAVAKSITSGWC